MKTYQQVLCPVDFSESSLNAARWGLELAALARCPLRLVHSYSLLLQDSETAATLYPEMLRISEDLMKRFLERLQVPPDLEVHNVNTPLDIAQELRIRCEEVPFSMIVMSTKGAKGFTRFLLGTNAVSVLHSVEVPVLVVPETCAWPDKSKGLSPWVFAVNPLNSTYELATAWLRSFSELLGIQMNPGFVATGKSSSEEKAYFLQWAAVQFPNQEPVTVVSENPISGIEDLIFQSKAEGLLMIARDKGWFRDLLRRHTADEMVFMGRYPVLVVPERLNIGINDSVSGPSEQ